MEVSILSKKRLTVDILREKIGYIVPPERLLRISRRFSDLKKAIREALLDSPKSAPEIAKVTNIDVYELSWFLATLLRHGVVRVVGKDDEDRYIFEWAGEEL